ncbi:MAG: HEAT repeat domain-containing protein [Vicinamibacteria bacterium]|nr:HEAT repeat domain-containing protein [Vicinamibacteria bacterium]
MLWWTLRQLHSADRDIFLDAAQKVGELRETRAVEPLIEALTSESEFVREGAIKALGLIGDRRAIAALRPLLGDKDALVQSAARSALRQLGDTAGDASSPVRSESIKTPKANPAPAASGSRASQLSQTPVPASAAAAATVLPAPDAPASDAKALEQEFAPEPLQRFASRSWPRCSRTAIASCGAWPFAPSRV